MNKLIEKMKTDGKCYQTVKTWYDEMIQDIAKCSYMAQNNQAYIESNTYKTADRLHENIFGFLSGLLAMEYITPKEYEIYTEELIEEFEF